jgi:hypothetical protein
MRRWVAEVGAAALLTVAGLISILGTVGWPRAWLGPRSPGSTLRYILLATLFVPYLVRAWAGRDSYHDRAVEAFIVLAVNLAVIAAVLWAVATLPRAALLAIIVIGIQAAFTYRAWRRARGLRPR